MQCYMKYHDILDPVMTFINIIAIIIILAPCTLVRHGQDVSSIWIWYTYIEGTLSDKVSHVQNDNDNDNNNNDNNHDDDNNDNDNNNDILIIIIMIIMMMMMISDNDEDDNDNDSNNNNDNNNKQFHQLQLFY